MDDKRGNKKKRNPVEYIVHWPLFFLKKKNGRIMKKEEEKID